MKRLGDNTIAFILSIISGALLIISGTNGVPSIEFFEGIILRFFDISVLRILFWILTILASFGGLSVFIGGLFIYKDRIRTGRFIIGVGSGAGILTLILNFLILISTTGVPIGWFFSFSTLGTILSIVARIIVNPKKLKII